MAAQVRLSSTAQVSAAVPGQRSHGHCLSSQAGGHTNTRALTLMSPASPVSTASGNVAGTDLHTRHVTGMSTRASHSLLAHCWAALSMCGAVRVRLNRGRGLWVSGSHRAVSHTWLHPI